jgi:2-amino-4-hydroxy-6-hydroxymethyldihydropteridine diphosphokinase
MPKLYLLLGSNMGDRTQYLQQATDEITLKVGKVLNKSSLFETAAWGNTNQPLFVNQVLEAETDLQPEEVLLSIHTIEQKLGRIRFEHWGSRVIDIDILFYDTLILQTQRLTIPHPQLHNRRFTLVPLAEIAASFEHPVLHKNIQLLLDECTDELEVTIYRS